MEAAGLATGPQTWSNQTGTGMSSGGMVYVPEESLQWVQ